MNSLVHWDSLPRFKSRNKATGAMLRRNGDYIENHSLF